MVEGQQPPGVADLAVSVGTAPAKVRLTPAKHQDVRQVAELHCSGISEGFLALLGPGFLRRMYDEVRVDPHSFILVCRQEGRMVGFVAGTENTRAFYRQFLRRRGVVAGLSASPRLLRGVPRAWETLRYGMGEPADDLPAAELLAMAVDPTARGKGLGTVLAQACVAEFRHRQVGAARVVVAAHNQAAVRTYRRAGFADASVTEVHRGTTSLVLRWQDRPETA